MSIIDVNKKIKDKRIIENIESDIIKARRALNSFTLVNYKDSGVYYEKLKMSTNAIDLLDLALEKINFLKEGL